jgi:hypothetical protein
MCMIPYKNWEMAVSENLEELEEKVEKSNLPGVHISKRKGIESSFLITKNNYLGPLGPVAQMTFCRRNNASQIRVTIRPYHVVTIVMLGGVLCSLLGTKIPILLATGDFLPFLISLIFIFLGYIMYWLSFDKIADQLENRIVVILGKPINGTEPGK